MPWDSVEVGLAGGEETVNFGPRNETGSSLYQVDTLASVSPRGEVRLCMSCWLMHRFYNEFAFVCTYLICFI